MRRIRPCAEQVYCLCVWIEEHPASFLFQSETAGPWWHRLAVQTGFDIVKDIPFLADAAEIVLIHHERFDGGGYPRRLKGEEILLGARIFAVADTLDAITSDRPYRRASSFESVCEIIRREAGRQFDPEVVSVFLSIPSETWQTIAKNQRQVASLSPELRRSQGIRRLGLGVLP